MLPIEPKKKIDGELLRFFTLAIIDNIKHKIEIKLAKYSNATRIVAMISPPDNSASLETSVIL